jgi:hypothetical protein
MTEAQAREAIRTAISQGYTSEKLAVDFAAVWLTQGHDDPTPETVALVQRVWDRRFRATLEATP